LRAPLRTAGGKLNERTREPHNACPRVTVLQRQDSTAAKLSISVSDTKFDR
jgi:hypothetical protein